MILSFNIDNPGKRLDVKEAVGFGINENDELLNNIEYDDGFDTRNIDWDKEGVDDLFENFKDKWETPGNAAAKAAVYGLPAMVRGDPLGCGCEEAHLHGIGKVKNGQIEADYMCDVGWHNYMVFSVNEKKTKKKREVKLDKFGKVMEDEGFKATDLEEL
jgi:hypothetical protein